MNKNNISVFKGMQRAAVALLLCLSALSAHAGDVMTKKADGTYVVRTTTICKARGYRKGTPEIGRAHV